MQNMQNHFQICRICVKPKIAKHIVYAKYVMNMQINMLNMYIKMQKYAEYEKYAKKIPYIQNMKRKYAKIC